MSRQPLQLTRSAAASRSALEKWNQSVESTLIQDFDTLSDFTIGGSPSVSEISNLHNTQGNGSLLMTAAASPGTADFALNNLTFGPTNPCEGLLRYFTSAAANFTSVILYLSTSDNFAAGTWTSVTLNNYESLTSQAQLKTGVNNRIFSRSDFSGGTPTLLDSAANVFIKARVRLEIGKGPCEFDGLWFHNQGRKPRPACLVMFDDGHGSLFTVNAAVFGTGNSAFDYMQMLGIRGTLCLDHTLLGVTNYMTVANVQTLFDAEWDIANHVESLDMVSETVADVTAALERTTNLYLRKGWITPAINFVAYPNGSYRVNGETESMLKGYGYASGRQIQATLLNNQIDPDNLFHLYAKGVGTGITAANITDQIDSAISSGRMFAFYVHGLDAAETAYFWDPAKLKTVLDYIKSSGIEALTWGDWFARVTGERTKAITRSAA